MESDEQTAAVEINKITTKPTTKIAAMVMSFFKSTIVRRNPKNTVMAAVDEGAHAESDEDGNKNAYVEEEDDN